jgi:hypothetical protein
LALVSHVLSTTAFSKKKSLAENAPQATSKSIEGFEKEKGLRGPTPAWRFWG